MTSGYTLDFNDLVVCNVLLPLRLAMAEFTDPRERAAPPRRRQLRDLGIYAKADFDGLRRRTRRGEQGRNGIRCLNGATIDTHVKHQTKSLSPMRRSDGSKMPLRTQTRQARHTPFQGHR